MSTLSHKQTNFPTARLSIFIKDKPVLQGKFYTLNEKPVFLVNIDDNKLFRNYNGYSIAQQIIEGFSKAKLRPLILYKHITRNIIYQTTPSTFTKKGVLVDYGGHKQFVLPIKNWKTFKGDLQEPYNLPQMTIDELIKPPKKYYPSISQDDYIKQRMKLKELFLQATQTKM